MEVEVAVALAVFPSNKRPLTCNVLADRYRFKVNFPHTHSESQARIRILNDAFLVTSTICWVV